MSIAWRLKRPALRLGREYPSNEMRASKTVALALLLGISCGSEDSGDVRAPETKLAPAPTRPSAEQQARAEQLLTGSDWYRHAVFYEINVRSFADSNGDGIGDLAGVVSRLDYLKDLGVDALWLMPIYPTRFKDSGYDIADYRGINPDYGDMAAFETLIHVAHARKMRVLMDLVLNHTSDLHPWFVESRSSKTNPKAGWYVWSDTAARDDIGTCNSGNPMFGPSWTLDETRGQHFFHRYYPEQPDLDYRNPEVVDATLDVVRFWVEDKGLDGYRCDVGPDGASSMCPAGPSAGTGSRCRKWRRKNFSTSSTSEYITGTSTSVRKVAIRMPAMMAMAIGPHQAACSPPM
jgi:1,4-alpha-glucan branching enzyme